MGALLVSRIDLLALLICAASALSTPASAQGEMEGDSPSSVIEEGGGNREGADFRELQALYDKGDYQAVARAAGRFERKYPSSSLLPQVRNLRGLTYLLTRHASLAVKEFKRSLESSPNPGFRQFVLYNLAAAHVEANAPDDAFQTLAEISPEALDKDTRIKFHLLKAKVLQKRGIPLEVARELLAASRLLPPSQLQGPMFDSLDGALESAPDPAALELLYKEYEESPLADRVLFRLSAKEIAAGKTAAGEARLKVFLARYPQSKHAAEAADLLRMVQSQTSVDGAAVGVLLPMKGRFAKFGARSLLAIQLAFRIFNPEEPDSKVTLVLEDSGEDPEQAVKGLENLCNKHHVVAVIGPLLSKGIDRVTQRAQELGVPTITLAQQQGTLGSFVFHSAMTPQLQAQEIARHAVERLGLKRFAIMYPRDRFGDQYAHAFWDAVEARGGRVMGFESYPPGETDFRQQVDKLSGLFYTEARQRELDALAKEREANNIKKRTRKTEQFYALKPIVDYDAVFIPDEPKVVGQILPTFAYRDVDKVHFLGIATWHSQELLARAQAYAEGATFVDAFFPESDSPTVKRFVARFKATFGQEPSAIEAMAHDAAGILDQALQASTTRNRIDVRERLKTIASYSGVTGRISYRDGQFIRDLSVLTVKGGKITEARP